MKNYKETKNEHGTIREYDDGTVSFSNSEVMTEYASEYGLHYELYGDPINHKHRLIETGIINPENDQKTISALIDVDDEAYHHAEMELTITSQYHDWSDTVASRLSQEVDNIARQLDDEDEDNINYYIDRELIEEYNKLVGDYNQYGDKPYIDIVEDDKKQFDILCEYFQKY